MSYRIGECRFRNFGPFEDAAVDFGQPGLTGIEGVISWKPGANSNGAGKSMLLKGVVWTLFGECQDMSGDDVVRIGSKGGADGEVNVTGGAHHVAVRRFRKHPEYKNHVYLYVDGQDVTRGTDPETQLAIDAVLGMNARTFRMGGPAFGMSDDVRSFFLATDTDRKSILDRILGLGLYTAAEKVAKARVSALAAKCAPVQEQRVALGARIEANEAVLRDLRATQDVDALTLAVSMARLRVRRLDEALAEGLAKVAAVQEDLQGLATLDREREEAHREEHRQWQALRDSVRAKIAKAEREAAVAKSRVDGVDRTVAQITSLEGAECPTCKRPVDAGTMRVMRADLDTEREPHLAAYTTASEEQAAWNAELRGLPPAPDQFVPDPSLRTVRVELAAREAEVQGFRVEQRGAQAELRSAESQLERATSQVDTLQREVDAQKEALAGLDSTYDALAAQLAIQELWAESFGNRGLKSYLMESEIPKLSQLATGYARRLCGPGAIVRLQATTALKTKDAVREKLSIEANIPGCCDSYAGASKGQRRRLDLALLFAFRALLSARVQSPFDQFFADELFDGLDDSGTESVIEFLREFSATCPVVLVTHNPFMRKAMDRIITVRHVGEYLAFVDQAGGAVPPAAKRIKKRLAV